MKYILRFVQEKRKILGIVAVALLVIVAGVIAFIAFNSDKLKVVSGQIRFYVTSEEGDSYCIYGTGGDTYQQLQVDEKQRNTLYVLNGLKDIESIYVVATDIDGQIVMQESVSGENETNKIALDNMTTGIYDLSFVIMDESGMNFYVSSESMLMDIVADESVKNQTVNMMTDISQLVSDEQLENAIEIQYPFVWNMLGHSYVTGKQLVFTSDDEGLMEIHNQGGSVETGTITCDTPLWDYVIDQCFGEFCEEHYYYIKARSVNERAVDITSMYIDSSEKLTGVLSYDTADEEADQIGRFLLPEQVTTIEIVGDYDMGTVVVDTPLTVQMSGASYVIYEGGMATLIWEGDGAPDLAEVERYMNVESYNGQAVDENIGGEGTCHILSGQLKLSSDRYNDMVVDGNYIDVYTGYADTIDPTEATFTYNLSGEGSASITAVGGSYYCKVLDDNGQTRGYKLNMIEKDYNLPVIYIETEGDVAITSKETVVPGTFSIDYNGTEEYENITDALMSIRGRGNSSWKLDKKPYKIKFDKKQSLFGLTEAKEWVLQANHADKSLIRNKLAMDMGSVLDNVLFTPHSYLVDVFVGGEYVGVYTLTEQIEVKTGRLEGEKDSTEVDTDYLLELGGDKEQTSFGNNMFSATLTLYAEIKNPDSDILTKEQYDYIKSYVDEADNAVKNLSGYEEYIDIPSLIDWFLLNEFSYNIDGTFRRSDFIMKKKGGKLYMATYWDYDYAFGNFWRDSYAFDEWICYGNENTVDDNYIWDNWMRYLLEDEAFITQLKARWAEVGETLYTTAMATIDEASTSVSPSAEENFSRWTGVLGKKTQYENYRVYKISTYEGQLQYLRDFIDKRYKWMDKTINAM